jgi:hypothetical protein
MPEPLKPSALRNNQQRVIFWQATAMVSLLLVLISYLAAVSAERACNL